MQESYENAAVKGFSLIEIIGRDLLTWRLVHDARPSHVCVIDSAAISDVCLVDEVGPILNAQRQQNQWRTVISFETHSPLYSMVYWRYNFVEEHEGGYHLSDTWHAVEPRVFLWAFPQGTVLDELQPAALQAGLYTWDDRVYATAMAMRITAEARFHPAGPGETPSTGRSTTPPNLATLTQVMPPAPGLPLIMDQVRQRCAGGGLLGASQVIRHLMGL